MFTDSASEGVLDDLFGPLLMPGVNDFRLVLFFVVFNFTQLYKGKICIYFKYCKCVQRNEMPRSQISRNLIT